MAVIKRDALETARAAWGDEMPAWVEALAIEVNRTSGAAAARRIGYSAPVVSSILAKRYTGRIDNVEARVSGALLGETVLCRLLGEITRDRCIDEQQTGFSSSSSIRAALFRECRSGRCAHSRVSADR